MRQDRIDIIFETDTFSNIQNIPKNNQSFVLYWMQQSQRVEYNHALLYAINEANQYDLPLVVFFGVSESYPEANERHYVFMIEGLCEVELRLKAMGITFLLLRGSPQQSIIELLGKSVILIMDKGYLTLQRKWRSEVAQKAREMGVSRCVQIESDLIIPVETTSQKEEYMARTLRTKIEKYLIQADTEFKLPDINQKGEIELKDLKVLQVDAYKTWIPSLLIDHSIKKSDYFTGGRSHALKLLDEFIFEKLEYYAESNSPANEYTSKMSLYLHFGQISSLEIYQRLQMLHESDESKKKFIEQLIVRRELAYNYCYYRQGYDKFETMTNPWAYITMALHRQDTRKYIYTKEELINGNTHDPYFNAAMLEMVKTGFMHGYMRMYWCKKIIEWSKTHEEAYRTALELNNAYFIDGRDPNSYTGIAWCFGLHDQGFRERDVFGKLRFMSADGLKKKFNMEYYIQRIRELK